LGNNRPDFTNQRREKRGVMKKYYYYSIIGLRATGETFMKIVCVKTLYSAFKNSNDYICKALEHVVNKYNIGVTNINVLYSANEKLKNMPNTDYIDAAAE
jgi:hypothetical protein